MLKVLKDRKKQRYECIPCQDQYAEDKNIYQENYNRQETSATGCGKVISW